MDCISPKGDIIMATIKEEEAMNFREYNQEQGQFIPLILTKAIEEDHPARVINDIIEALDISGIYDYYSKEGNPSYHPLMMLKVLFYCYMIGVFSCRKIRDRLEDYNLPLLYLAAGNMPSFTTINNFRKRHLSALPAIFTQIVLLCIELRMVDFGFLAIDGQKIHANASFRQSKTNKDLRKEIERIEQQMKELLTREPAEDEDEETRKKELALFNRKNKIEQAIKELKERTRDEDDEEKKNKMRINVTDKDAPVMTHKDGTKKPSYETYTAVDSLFQIITAFDCNSNYNETHETIPLIIQSSINCGGEFHRIAGLDSGFSSLENLLKMSALPLDILMPDRLFEKWARDDKDMEFDKSKFVLDTTTRSVACPMGSPMKLISTSVRDAYTRRIYRGTSCENCPVKAMCTKGKARTITIDSRDELQTKMREKLIEESNKNEYKKRMYTVEPVFGNMQKNKGWKQFHLRGKEKTKGEFGLQVISHNLKKIVLHMHELTIDLKLAIDKMVAQYSLMAVPM